MYITVEVKQEHIDAGKQLAPQGCPVYYAMKAAGISVVRVFQTMFQIEGEPGHYLDKGRPLPPAVTKRIQRYRVGPGLVERR